MLSSRRDYDVSDEAGYRMRQRYEAWHVYILRCADNSYYTGIAKNVEARVHAHNLGRGAAYTRAHRPVQVVYREKKLSRVAALLREIAIKRLTRVEKIRLVLRGRPFKTKLRKKSKNQTPWDIIFKRNRRRNFKK